IDCPMRWKHTRPEFQAQMKAEAQSKEAYFGETGEIVAYDPTEENGNTLVIVLDGSKQVVQLYQGAVTITSDAVNQNKEVIDLLGQILTAVKAWRQAPR